MQNTFKLNSSVTDEMRREAQRASDFLHESKPERNDLDKIEDLFSVNRLNQDWSKGPKNYFDHSQNVWSMNNEQGNSYLKNDPSISLKQLRKNLDLKGLSSEQRIGGIDRSFMVGVNKMNEAHKKLFADSSNPEQVELLDTTKKIEKSYFDYRSAKETFEITKSDDDKNTLIATRGALLKDFNAYKSQVPEFDQRAEALGQVKDSLKKPSDSWRKGPRDFTTNDVSAKLSSIPNGADKVEAVTNTFSKIYADMEKNQLSERKELVEALKANKTWASPEDLDKQKKTFEVERNFVDFSKQKEISKSVCYQDEADKLNINEGHLLKSFSDYKAIGNKQVQPVADDLGIQKHFPTQSVNDDSIKKAGHAMEKSHDEQLKSFKHTKDNKAEAQLLMSKIDLEVAHFDHAKLVHESKGLTDSKTLSQIEKSSSSLKEQEASYKQASKPTSKVDIELPLELDRTKHQEHSRGGQAQEKASPESESFANSLLARMQTKQSVSQNINKVRTMSLTR